MYADRHARPEGIKPGSLAIAIGINGALVGALMFASPAIEMIKQKDPLRIFVVPDEVPPPPNIIPETKPQPDAREAVVRETINTTKPIVETGTADSVLPALPPLPLPTFPTGGGTVIDPPVAPPVMTDAVIDQRYARYLQPEYPAGERRAEREGFATVRITIGADGRVSAAECVSATSDAFCNVTKAQALAKWRFTPATRDGIAIGASKVMTVRFKLEQ